MSALIEWKIKRFNELTVQELYSVLQLRSIVFVVEQNCVYQDLDGKDEKAVHLLGFYNNEIVAYARLFKSGDYFKNASIGRVVIHPKARDKKFGHDMMRKAIAVIDAYFGETTITISAQLYLQKFYESHAFVVQGETYLEDDIPHIEMKRE